MNENINELKTVDVDIAGIKISFCCNQKIKENLTREFSGLIVTNADNIDIKFNIINKKYDLDQNAILLFNSTYSYQDNIIQLLESKGNKIWIEYFLNSGLPISVNVYIPYTTDSEFSKIFHPSFLPRWKISMLNFIHGPFIGIIELYLLKKGSSFFHASAVNLKSEGGIAFTGFGQTGKSTFIKWLADKRGTSIVSEDLCIISPKNILKSYPKQSRLDLSSVKNYKKYFSPLKNKEFTDILNYILFFPFKFLGIKPKRILAINEMFTNTDIILQTRLNKIYCIQRENSINKVEPISKKDFIQFCVENMMVEITNIAGFKELVKAIELTHCEPMIYKHIRNQMEYIFNQVYDNVNCYFVNIPYHDDIEITKKFILDLVINTEKGDINYED